MPYLTDRKRAMGLGAAGSGAQAHWRTMISSAGLLILVPLFVFTFGAALGRPYVEVLAYYAQPFPAIVGVLTLLVGFFHFKDGVQVAIEDYTDGLTRKLLIIAMICVSYAAAAVGVFAIARIAL